VTGIISVALSLYVQPVARPKRIASDLITLTKELPRMLKHQRRKNEED